MTNNKIEDFKDGDKITLEIIGLGIGTAEIRLIDGELCIYEESQGHETLKEAMENELIFITPIEKLETKTE